jgi:hypothetical protein
MPQPQQQRACMPCRRQQGGRSSRVMARNTGAKQPHSKTASTRLAGRRRIGELNRNLIYDFKNCILYAHLVVGQFESSSFKGCPAITAVLNALAIRARCYADPVERKSAQAICASWRAACGSKRWAALFRRLPRMSASSAVIPCLPALSAVRNQEVVSTVSPSPKQTRF